MSVSQATAVSISSNYLVFRYVRNLCQKPLPAFSVLQVSPQLRLRFLSGKALICLREEFHQSSKARAMERGVSCSLEKRAWKPTSKWFRLPPSKPVVYAPVHCEIEMALHYLSKNLSWYHLHSQDVSHPGSGVQVMRWISELSRCAISPVREYTSINCLSFRV